MWATLKAFYNSDTWESFRKVLILERGKERGIICEDCGKHIIESKDIILHHFPIELTLENVSNYSVSLNPDNIKIVCFDCHNIAHKRFGRGNAYYERRHNGIYIVYGSPLSGKSTFVRENAKRGDIIVDMDKLFEAISNCPMHDKPENIKANVFALRNLLLDNIKTRYGGFNSAWVIGGYPKRFDRERLSKELGAELIFIESTKEECYLKLEMCSDYRSKKKGEIRSYIDKWFEEYSA